MLTEQQVVMCRNAGVFICNVCVFVPQRNYCANTSAQFVFV